MANLILDNNTRTFISDFMITEKSPQVQFEHFVNYCVITKLYNDAYNSDRQFYEYVHTGSGGDLGIDGILVTINDIIVSNKDEFDDVYKLNPHITPRFIFIQAKTSSEFATGDMLKTGSGVLSMFAFGEEHTYNDKVEKKFKLIKHIFDKSYDFSENPECLIYYVTQGKWAADVNQTTAKTNIEKQLYALGVFSNVEFRAIDAEELMQISREINNQIVKVLPFSKRTSFPTIKDVSEAYLGLVGAQDYIDLITDKNKDLQRSLFYENVRGFLGDNPVNSEIESTLKDPSKRGKFPIFNNGVTIVSRSMMTTGDNVKLTDFQIVNGCQTSNVLYKNRSVIDNTVMIPVKLIATTDTEVIADVVKSTNRQTYVALETFESLKPFHKKLQDYYRALEAKYQLYYERRMNEYSAANGVRVKKYQIITLASQLKTVISMFWSDPHSTHRYYGELLKAYYNNNRIFQENHVMDFYYVSALTMYNVETAFYQGIVSSKYKPYRFHLLLVLRILFLKKDQVARLNSHDMERDCQTIINALSDKKLFEIKIRQASSIIDYCLKNTKLIAKHQATLDRRKEFTQEIIDATKASV